MYVWRKKNRRDKRDLLTSGVEYWGPPVGSKNTEAKDEEIRRQNEQLFVDSLVLSLRKTIHKYLSTRHGAMEINHVIHEIELLEAPDPGEDPDGVSLPMSIKKTEKQRKNVKEIFRKYDADGSLSIDLDELRCLLKDLQIPILAEKELKALFNELDPDQEGAIGFDNFYGWFDREANKSRRKSWWHFFKSTGANLGGRFKRMILEVEARNAIIDKVVDDTRRHAYEEFRRAHPPRFPCTHRHCFACFPNPTKLNKHVLDNKYHEKLDFEMGEVAHKLLAVENAFKGNQGRRLHANRLLFSVDLADLKPRLHNLTEQPYRPHLSDPGSQREGQLRQGMLVLGADPKAGIRPVAMSRNLRRQHRANCTLPPVPANINDIHQQLGDFNKPNLGATLMELMQCRDEKVDTVVTNELGGRKDIIFEWKGYVHSDTEIIGEFTGWKREALFPDAETGRLSIMKSLCAGRYRYRYIVDGQETVDPFASQIRDGDVVSNVILVVNPPVPRPALPTFGPDKIRDEKGHDIDEDPPEATSKPSIAGVNGDPVYAHRDTIDLRNTRLCDDGAWALTVSVQINSIILHLDLSYNDISDNGISAVSIAVGRLKKLETLKLNGNGFSSDGVNHLVKVLKTSTTLRRLELCSNRLGDDGAEFLAESLIKFHASLEELFIDSNYIGNDGAACIGEALVRNRTIRILSIGDNRIYPAGADRLCTHLRRNGYLRSLRIHCNPLGPLGIKSVGEMLAFNDSIKHVDISSTNMMRNNDVQGYHALTFMLKRNRGLEHLVIRNSGLNAENIVELGYAVHKNKGLKILDMDSNYIPDKWWLPDHFIDTKLMMQMPSIRTSLDKHIEHAADPLLGPRYAVHPRQMEDGFVGIWTSRRIWTSKDREGEFQKAKKKKQLASEEATRMNAEDVYVLDNSMREIDKFKLSLTESKSGRKLVKSVTKVIDVYIRSLEKLAPVEDALVDITHTAAQSTKSVESVQEIDIESGKVVAPSVEWLALVHQAILAAVFEVNGADQKTLQLPFKDIGLVLESLCIPLSDELILALIEKCEKKQHQKKNNKHGSFKRHSLIRLKSSRSASTMNSINGPALLAKDKGTEISRNMSVASYDSANTDDTEGTAKRPDTIEERLNMDGSVDFYKFVKGFVELVPRTIMHRKLAHIQALAVSLLKSKKREIAENLLLRASQHSIVKNFIYQYRKQPDKAPLFLCEECNERFHSLSSLDKHKSKARSHHFKYYRELNLWRSREAVVREAKFLITGQRFPMYYTLRDALTLPRDFYPQVYDSHGAEARPIGVIEPEYLVRVNDATDEWLKIAFDGGVGWMMQRANNIPVMLPAYPVNGFWDTLHPFHEPVFYHVRFELPLKAEIKVRYAPHPKAAVCGALKRGMVVSAGAILDDKWLEIRYNLIDAVWVLLSSTSGIQLMKEVDESLQMPFANTIKVSPVVMTEEELLPITKPEMSEGFLEDEVDYRPNTATSVATSAAYSDEGELLLA